jgi:hypothetical protein
MCQCWCETPSTRPKFSQLCRQIEELLSKDRDYLELYNCNISIDPDSRSSSDDAQGCTAEERRFLQQPTLDTYNGGDLQDDCALGCKNECIVVSYRTFAPRSVTSIAHPGAHTATTTFSINASSN